MTSLGALPFWRDEGVWEFIVLYIVGEETPSKLLGTQHEETPLIFTVQDKRLDIHCQT